MAGGTVFFARLRTPPVQFERGMCDLISFFWHGETRVLFLHVLFETKYKPNETEPTVDVRHSHVKHCSHVEHRFLFFSRNTGEREALLMKHCSDVKHSSLDVNLCMSVEFVLSFACLWTHLDRVGLQFLMFLQCFGWKARQSRCNDLHATKDVRYMTQLTRPIQHLRSLGPSKRLNCGTRLWVRVCVETAFN